jgi:hypothetical protein
MKRTCSILITTAIAACGAPPKPLGAQVAVGAANTDPGRVLVLSASCGSMESQCRMHWAEAVDTIVVGGLEFHGYSTIDPSTLRKDEAKRTETEVTADSREERTSETSTKELGIIDIFPVATMGSTSSHSVRVTESRQKTVVVEGATIEDLRPEDRRTLMEQAGAGSVLSTRVIVGASYSVWSQRQVVEVMIKLSDAYDGTMRWSARCAASSADHPTVDAAIEAAAHCAVDVITAPVR